jgi:phage shock protein PspC (stress-responsive transcriptional regulator)
MHKTVSASIGSSLFTVEESAYASLDAYLSSIRSHFGASAESDEIVSDIESRIAEEFSEALGTKRKVVLKDDVDAVIARMGTVEDFRKFDGESAAAAHHGTADGKLRLYRDADDQMIGGVCSGIAKYFGIDPLIVRIAFLLSLLIGGFGIIVYVLLWIFLPEARTTAEKVEMTGGRVTLSAIQHRIDAVVSPEQRKGVVARVIRFPFAVIGSVLRGIARVARFVFPILGRIAGVLVTVWAAFAMAFVTFVFLVLLTNPESPYIGFPLMEIVGFGTYVALLVSGYFAAFLPLFLVLLVGASLVMLRNLITGAAAAGIFAAWLLAAVATGVAVFNAAPELETGMRQFDGQSTAELLEVDAFDRVRADDMDRFDVSYGTGFSVIMDGTIEGVRLSEIDVEDGVLVTRERPNDNRCIFLCPSRHTRVTVTMPALTAVEASDASRVSLDGFSGSALELLARDVARIDGKVSATTMTLKAHDASRISLSGTAGDATVSTSGVARVDAIELTTQRATVTAADASRVGIDAVLSLTGSATDVSRIEYKTQPPTFDVDTSDHARARSTDDEEYDEYHDWE